jgi:hypothetical protein
MTREQHAETTPAASPRTLPPELRDALRSAARRARLSAQQVGTMSGLWDVIFDAEAVLDGRATMLAGPPEQIARRCLRALTPVREGRAAEA